jgi:diaminopimelate decarboxylase
MNLPAPLANPHGADCLSIRDGHLFVDELDTVALAEEFGTPLFVFSETQLRRNVGRFRAAFEAVWPDGPVDVLPAMKANTVLAVRHVLSDEGTGADIYSAEELEGALRTSIDPARVSVNGGGKERAHLRRCVAAGVRITVEDVHEIALIEEVAAELGATARIRLRVKPAVPNLWRRTDFSQLSVPIDLGYQVYKSGIPAEYLVELGREAMAAPHVELVGLHFHAGRHHPSLWYWQGLMARFGRLVGELSAAWGGWQPEEIDIGGGWPSPRDPHNEELPRAEFLVTALGYPFLVGLRGLGERAYHAAMAKVVPALTSHTARKAPPAIEDFARVAVTTLRRELRDAGVTTAGVRLQVEPGRSLFGDIGVHLARVKVVKRQTQPIPYTWVLTDTTYFFLAGGVFEKNRHPHLVANRAAEAATMQADIVGHSCFADQIVLGARLPAVVAGDVVALLEAGAYQESSASNFNSLPRPATVLVSGDRAEVIKRAETIDDVYARDVVPDRLRTTGRAGADAQRHEQLASVAGDATAPARVAGAGTPAGR